LASIASLEKLAPLRAHEVGEGGAALLLTSQNPSLSDLNDGYDAVIFASIFRV
jgi:hypothetical protein